MKLLSDKHQDVLEMSVREFLERATKLIIMESERWPDFDRRIDCEFEIELFDPKLKRTHRVRTKLRVTSRSEIFNRPTSR